VKYVQLVARKRTVLLIEAVGGWINRDGQYVPPCFESCCSLLDADTLMKQLDRDWRYDSLETTY
jgi:hypothetical protein